MAQSRDDVFDATGRRTRLAGVATNDEGTTTNYPWGAMRGWPMNTSDYSGAGVPTNGISGFHTGATWQNFKSTGAGTCFYVNVGTNDSSNWLNIDGPISNLSSDEIVIAANTGPDAFTVNDGTTDYLAFDSRNTVSGVKNVSITGNSPTIASASGDKYSAFYVNPATITLTGTTTVTALDGVGLYVDQPTVTDASAGTVTTLSNFYVAAPAAAGGSLTITHSYSAHFGGGLLIDSGGATVTAGGATITAGGLTVTAGGATITAGGLTVSAGGINLAAEAQTITIDAATAAALVVSDGVVSMISLDTTTTASTTVGKGGVTLTGEAASVASAASAFAAPTLYLATKTNTLTGTTTTTSWLGSALYVGAQTWTDSSSCTLTTASAIHIVANASAGGDLTITNSYMISTSVSGCYLSNAGSWTSASSAAHKEEIEDAKAQDVFGVLDSIRPRSYYLKGECNDRRRQRIGLIAEELPEALVPPGHGEDGLPVGLPDGIAAAFAIATCKALREENRDLMARLERLEAHAGI